MDRLARRPPRLTGAAVVLSAGVLLFRPGPRADGVEMLLGHMGGPFWARRDEGAWSMPKGEHGPDEDPRDAAAREFAEELGAPLPPGPLLELGTVRQPSGKRLTAFALRADFDADTISSNLFEIEWPRGSGRMRSFPELDRAAWFDVPTGRRKVVRGQVEFLDRLLALPPG